MMTTITHKFLHYPPKADTEILIIGTFNPDAVGNAAEYFYGRSRNNLWQLLPLAFSEASLKGKPLEDKIVFADRHKIGFTDLISSVRVEKGQETNYDDQFLDGRVVAWTDIIEMLAGLKHIKSVCFTRKTLTGIPNMKRRITEIEAYCQQYQIRFSYLVTPARFYSAEKQAIWNAFFK